MNLSLTPTSRKLHTYTWPFCEWSNRTTRYSNLHSVHLYICRSIFFWHLRRYRVYFRCRYNWKNWQDHLFLMFHPVFGRYVLKRWLKCVSATKLTNKFINYFQTSKQKVFKQWFRLQYLAYLHHTCRIHQNSYHFSQNIKQTFKRLKM